MSGHHLVNMSVWESLEALRGFVYSGPHLEVMGRRREWFERIGTPILALWWVPAGPLPTVADAERRVERLGARGPTPLAFDFRRPFSPAGAPTPPRLPVGCR